MGLESPVHDCDIAGVLVNRQWVSIADRRPTEPVIGGDGRIRFGDAAVRLQDIHLEFEALPQDIDDVKKIFFFADDWKLNDWLLYRPAVYMCAFRRQVYLDQARLVVQSLRGIAGYTGQVVVITDIPERQAVAFLADTGPLSVVTIGAETKHETHTARYAAPLLAELQGFQPLLYVDTDIIFDAPIDATLLDILFSPLICVREDQAVRMRLNSLGGTLLQADAAIADNGAFGFNSGVIGMRNGALHRTKLAQIVEAARRIHGHPVSATLGRFVDQPIANYVAAKTGGFDQKTITGAVRYFAQGRLQGGAHRAGIVHFWGAGNAASKLAEMQRYLDELGGA